METDHMKQLREEHIPGTIAVVFYDGDVEWIHRMVFRKDAVDGPHLPGNADLWSVIAKFITREAPFAPSRQPEPY